MAPVLIVSTVVDLATDAVVEELHSLNVPLIRVNTEDFPFSAEIDYSIGLAEPSYIFGTRATSSREQFRSIWYRRLRSPSIPPEMDAGIYDFCVRETRSALTSALLAHQTGWMSQPDAIWKAEFKPYQLDLAASVGLNVPRTLISNNPENIRRFCAKFDQFIAKPVRSGYVIKNGVEFAIFTTKLEKEDLLDLSDARLCPTIYQELIRKKYDIRVTVVGAKVFAAAIDSQSDPKAIVDWRKTRDPDLPHFPIRLPDSLKRMLLEMMSRLSLAYGAIDLVLTPDDRYVFLEINPNGQWLWLDDMLSFGISRSIAEWLAEHPQ